MTEKTTEADKLAEQAEPKDSDAADGRDESAAEGEGNRPVPKVAPSLLLEELSHLWEYPEKGASGMRVKLQEIAGENACSTWSSEWEQLLNDLGAYNESDENIVGADAMQLDYTRMFIGSFRMYAPPYASYYLDGERQIYGPTTVEIEDLYAQFGIELKEEEHDMPDHVRFLLAFMSLLAGSYEAKGNIEFAYAYADFRETYVASWLPLFEARLGKYAEYPFYRSLATLTRKTI